MTKIEDLRKRVSRIAESTPPPPSPEDVIVGFINQLPGELRKQVVEYIKVHVHEGETKAA